MSLWEENIGLIGYMSNKYRNIRNPIVGQNDLCQVGSIALWKAEKGFDPKKGKFSTYGCMVIRNAFIALLRKEKISIKTENTAENPIMKRGSCVNYMNTDLKVIEDDDFMGFYLNKLKPQDKDILKERFWYGKILKEIGDSRKITKEAARQRVLTAMKRLKDIMQENIELELGEIL